MRWPTPAISLRRRSSGAVPMGWRSMHSSGSMLNSPRSLPMPAPRTFKPSSTKSARPAGSPSCATGSRRCTRRCSGRARARAWAASSRSTGSTTRGGCSPRRSRGSVRAFFAPRQLLHAPERELHNGGFTAYAETPARAESLLAAFGGADTPEDRGRGPSLAGHEAGYVEVLRTAAERWAAAGRPGDAIGYVWPVVGRRALRLDRIAALIGRYSFDASPPITAETWTSDKRSAQSALAATHAVLDGDRAALALCRPPGHHAGAEYYGGYCHLNAAAL